MRGDLPAYRYQLTSLDKYIPLYVKERIKNNQFVIASANGSQDKGAEVSWQITGIRNDNYMKKNPFIAEETKGTGTASGFEKGEYIHPDAFGVERKTETAGK